jgi:uncharacterized protein YutE (UPF0331/DUF86 family)
MEEIVSRFCNNCQHKTDHTILSVNEIKGNEPYDEEYYVSWSNTYTLYECKGCHEVHMEKVFWFSEWDEVEKTIYPPRISRKTPKWIESVPKKQKELLEEIYIALAANCTNLAVMGARSLIDLFILDKIGDSGTFIQKMQKLEENGFISKEQKEYINAALDTGHAVVHRGFNPDDDVVNKVMDIIENLLINYSLKKAGKELKRVTPKRKPAKKQKK